MSNAFIDYITSSAVSLTMAGNTGISPFLTLLLLGLVEMANPELLDMGPTMEMLLASWWSIVILGALALGEVSGKCIPAIDEIIDSVEVFIVPIISVLASVATLGLLPGSDVTQDDAGMGQSIDVIGILDGQNRYRSLQDDEGSFGGTNGFITFAKICLVLGGVGLSLAIHFFKMIVRVSSLGCSGGCCQPCITIVEEITVIFGVILAILVPFFAVVACFLLLLAAGYVIYVKCCNKKKDDASRPPGINNKCDLEKQQTSPPSTLPTPTVDMALDESKVGDKPITKV